MTKSAFDLCNLRNAFALLRAPAALGLVIAIAAACGGGQPHTGSAAAPAKSAAFTPDRSGDVETRLRRVEDYLAANHEAIEFLGKVYAQQKAQEEEQEANEPDPNAVFAVDIAGDLKVGQVNGPATAPVTIVKCFDFACPYCQRVASTMDQLVAEYGGKVRVVYKNMIVHPDVATTAHLASCAAAKQGKYLAFKDAVWIKGFLAYAAARDPSKLGEENLMTIAKDVGLNVPKLKADMKSEDCKQLLADDAKELEKFQVNSTPTFFINGVHVAGALDKEDFKQIIDQRLKIAEASGVAGAEYYAKEVMGKGEKKFRSKKDAKPK